MISELHGSAVLPPPPPHALYGHYFGGRNSEQGYAVRIPGMCKLRPVGRVWPVKNEVRPATLFVIVNTKVVLIFIFSCAE
jgi:hypothetical protein